MVLLLLFRQILSVLFQQIVYKAIGPDEDRDDDSCGQRKLEKSEGIFISADTEYQSADVERGDNYDADPGKDTFDFFQNKFISII